MTYAEKALLVRMERQIAELIERVEALEARPKRGRPPKQRHDGKEAH